MILHSIFKESESNFSFFLLKCGLYFWLMSANRYCFLGLVEAGQLLSQNITCRASWRRKYLYNGQQYRYTMYILTEKETHTFVLPVWCFQSGDLQPHYHLAIQGLENNIKPSACAPVGQLVAMMLRCKYITATHMLKILLDCMSWILFFFVCLPDGGRCVRHMWVLWDWLCCK